MRVVIDTNVLVSALIWRASLRGIGDLINERAITLCFNESTLVELRRVLRYSHILRKMEERGMDPEDVICIVESSSLVVKDSPHPIVISDDPSDNAFLGCAVDTDAACIVSGDAHILRLETYSGIPILTPRQFMNRFIYPQLINKF